jgi:hypothetical protein
MVASIFILINLFFLTLQSRYIFGGDSAEYVTVAKTWGIAHPPGYPLYSLLSNLIERLMPFGTTPWKVSILSSIPTMVTAYIIYKILLHLKIRSGIALLTALLYLFLFPVWQYALIPEVFALHTLLISLITYLLLLYTKKSKAIYILVASFIAGLCVSNHHIFILFVPGWILLLKGKVKKIVQNKKLCIQMLALVCIGASFYIYAIIVSFCKTILDWENAKTIQGFFSLITRSSYGTFKAYSGSGANIGNQLSDMISGLVFILMDFKPLGILFIGLGLVMIRKYGRQFANFLYYSLVIHFIFLFYTNFVLTTTVSSGMYERFLIPIYLLLIISLGIGIDYMYKNYYIKIILLIKNNFLKKVVSVAYYIFVILFIFIIAKQNFKTISQISNINSFEQFGVDIIDTVPNGSILTTQGDTATFTSMYQLYGLKKRNDIVFFQLGLMGKSNYIDMIKKRAPDLKIEKPVKETKDFEEFVVKNSSRGYYAEREMNVGTWRPYGLLWKYYPDNLSASSDSANLLAANKKLWEKYKIPLLTESEKNLFHLKSIEEYYISSYQNYAKLLIFLSKYNDAELVLKNISEKYMQKDIQSKVEYMNMLVLQNKCREAASLATEINISNTVKKYPGFVIPALSYLESCDPKNIDIPRYKKILHEYEKSSKVKLNSF